MLEWSMKLWWVHNEAMIALLMAYKVNKDEALLNKFEEISRYCEDHVSINRF